MQPENQNKAIEDKGLIARRALLAAATGEDDPDCVQNDRAVEEQDSYPCKRSDVVFNGREAYGTLKTMTSLAVSPVFAES